jgi:hypothetical protein
MDVKEGLELAEQLVGRTLKPLEIDIFEESWKGREGKKYREIAETYPCREGHVNDVASDLWKLLSKALGKKVIKSNFRRELEKRSRSHSAEVPQPQEEAQEETVSKNTDFVGREEAIAHLNTLIASRNAKVIGIYGKGGVGKTKLAEQYFERYFEANGFKTLRLNVGTETRSITRVEGWLEDCLRLDFREELGQKFDFTRLLDRLRRQLQAQRVGLLIDNLEPALDENGKFIEPGYVQLLRVFAEPTVNSITLITSRECPNESKVTLEPYPLPELDEDAWREFFRRFEINVNTPVLSAMHKAYGGNALAMKVLSHPIQTSYEGDLEAYWQDHKEYLLKGEIKDLVVSQFNRLQSLYIKAYKLLCRLGIYRYQNIPKVPLAGLLCLLWDVSEEERTQLIESLQRRHLVEFRKEKRDKVPKSWEGELFLKFPKEQGWILGFEYMQGQSNFVVFQPAGYSLHPVIWAEAIARLKSSGESHEKLLLSMKQQIDALVAFDDHLQKFLVWIDHKQKDLFFKISYKPALIRAFYLALAIDIGWDLSIEIDDRILEDNSAAHRMDIILAIEVNITFELAREISGILHLLYVFDPTSVFSELANNSDIDYIDFALEIVHGINGALQPKLNLNSELRKALQYLKLQLPEEAEHIAFVRYLAQVDKPSLIPKERKIPLVLLSQLKEIYGSKLRKSIETFETWFQAKGQDWLQQLANVMSRIPRRNIRDSWQFNEQQKQRLRQYYDVNRLLVDCLNNSSDVSPEVRSHIEDTLLLPIAEIEKRRLGD